MANDNTIFDDVFKTIIEKLPELVIPVINMQFGTDYSFDEKMESLSQEYHGDGSKVIADTVIKIKDNRYHIECQSNEDGTIAIRMLEYDFFIGLRNAKKEDKGSYRVRFPRSAIIYLRSNEQTEDEVTVHIEFGENNTNEYKIDIIKVNELTAQHIIEHKLYMFLPFYAMRYEKDKDKLNCNDDKLEEVVKEYNKLIEEFEKSYYNSASKNGINIALEVEKLSERIVNYVFKQQSKVREEIGGVVMGGKALKLVSEELAEKDEALAEKDEAIAEKDEAIAEKDEEIARLKAILAENNIKN